MLIIFLLMIVIGLITIYMIYRKGKINLEPNIGDLEDDIYGGEEYDEPPDADKKDYYDNDWWQEHYDPFTGDYNGYADASDLEDLDDNDD